MAGLTMERVLEMNEVLVDLLAKTMINLDSIDVSKEEGRTISQVTNIWTSKDYTYDLAKVSIYNFKDLEQSAINIAFSVCDDFKSIFIYSEEQFQQWVDFLS